MSDPAPAIKFGRFDDWTGNDLWFVLDEIIEGYLDEPSYMGAVCALRMAKAFLAHDNSPEADEVAIAQMGEIATYELNSWYYTPEAADEYDVDERAHLERLRSALEAMEAAALSAAAPREARRPLAVDLSLAVPAGRA